MQRVLWVSVINVFLLVGGCDGKQDTAAGGGDTGPGSDERADSDPGEKETSENETDSETASHTGTGSNPDIEWKRVAGGSFEMGSPLNESRRNANEQRHTVTLTHDFEMAATEITVGQWRALGFDWAYENYVYFCDRDDCPFFGVNDATIERWLDTLSAMNGLDACYTDGPFETPYHCNGYRLPTEAEWEYAARGGMETGTYNGDFTDETVREVLGPIAHCAGGVQADVPVGTLAPNAWGLYDMLGNVSEWTEWVGVYPAGSVSNPFFRVGGERFYTNRGGAVDELQNCRAAYRGRGRTGFETYDDATPYHDGVIGFRPVRTLPGSTLTSAPDGGEGSDCPEPVNYSCAAYGDDVSALLFSSTAVGEDVEFVAVSGAAYFLDEWDVGIAGVIGSGDGATAAAVAVDLETGEFKVFDYAGPEVGVRPVALLSWYPPGAAGPESSAILCADDACFLATPSLSDETLMPVSGGALPDGFKVRSAAVSNDRLIAVGSGIAVYDGETWTVAVAVDSGSPFNGVTGIDDKLVAVGDDGRLAFFDGAAWQEADSGIEEDLHSALLFQDRNGALRFEAVGEAGVVLSGEVSDAVGLVAGTVCHIFDGPLTHVSASGAMGGNRYYFTAGNEQIYQGDETLGVPPCFAAPQEAPVVFADLNPCFVCRHYLTKNALYGVHKLMSPP